MSQPYYDYFALANMSLQERLGRSGATLNRDSAVLGWQARSFVQMLNYGLDAITARAACHLINMDILNSNDAYLLKQSEGILLNSIESVTPPRLYRSSPFRFISAMSYSQWSTIGNITLKDGSNATILAYEVSKEGTLGNGDTRYVVTYCAGNYVQQDISDGFSGYTQGLFLPIFVSETYKSVWSDSVKVTLEFIGTDEKRDLDVAWSMDEILALPDASNAVLCQHTPRGIVATLGDGEIYGSAYNGKNVPAITGMSISYVKCDSLAPVDNSTISFNSDITPTGEVPVLAPLKVGDTANTLRVRAVREFFAAGKITHARDLETELRKIPWIRSVSARKEYDWPIGKTLHAIVNGKSAAEGTIDRVPYLKFLYDPKVTYTPGALVIYGDSFYFCVSTTPYGTPDELNGWVRFMSITDAEIFYASGVSHYPSANVFDNATIVVSGLVCASRKYWAPEGKYSVGDVVYHSGTHSLWLALKEDGAQVEPGSETDVSLYADNGNGRCWVNRENAQELVNSGYLDAHVMVGFMEYVPMTQAMFEAEFKGYFNIAGKLGFTSVVVEPLLQYFVHVDVMYSTKSPISNEVQSLIKDYICYEVGKDLRADELNSILTTRFNLTSVYINIYGSENENVENIKTGEHYQLPHSCYVPPENIVINIEERI